MVALRHLEFFPIVLLQTAGYLEAHCLHEHVQCSQVTLRALFDDLMTEFFLQVPEPDVIMEWAHCLPGNFSIGGRKAGIPTKTSIYHEFFTKAGIYLT